MTKSGTKHITFKSDNAVCHEPTSPEEAFARGMKWFLGKACGLHGTRPRWITNDCMTCQPVIPEELRLL